MDIVIIEIDLGKNSCSLAGMDALGIKEDLRQHEASARRVRTLKVMKSV
jgi:hypothetical protein